MSGFDTMLGEDVFVEAKRHRLGKIAGRRDDVAWRKKEFQAEYDKFIGEMDSQIEKNESRRVTLVARIGKPVPVGESDKLANELIALTTEIEQQTGRYRDRLAAFDARFARLQTEIDEVFAAEKELRAMNGEMRPAGA